MIKDLENLKGDLANNYKTIPIVWRNGFQTNYYSLSDVDYFTCVCPN
jgi:hypothetical protein